MLKIHAQSTAQSGFTLVELSIVLVIIGLLTGGILVGRDLIDAAAVSAQITQINKYQNAVTQFQTKYGYLPGDIPNPYATNYGFQSRGSLAGEGDGNGVIEGNCSNSSGQNFGYMCGCGELAVFWQDLGTAGLLDTSVPTGAGYPSISGASSTTLSSTPAIGNWIPPAKILTNDFVYVFSMNQTNYFGVSSVDKIGWTVQASRPPNVTVQQAYNIDNKMDDGLPQSGAVTACYVNYNVYNTLPIVWAAGGNGTTQGANGGTSCTSTTAATASATTNCYDNATAAIPAGVAGATQAYSVLHNATAKNCALSFQFQN